MQEQLREYHHRKIKLIVRQSLQPIETCCLYHYNRSVSIIKARIYVHTQGDIDKRVKAIKCVFWQYPPDELLLHILMLNHNLDDGHKHLSKKQIKQLYHKGKSRFKTMICNGKSS